MIEKITLTRYPDATTGWQGQWEARVEFGKRDPRSQHQDKYHTHHIGKSPEEAVAKAMSRADTYILDIQP